jgi:hypothetical protein
MLLSELKNEIESFIRNTGDRKIKFDFYCEDCGDVHEGSIIKIIYSREDESVDLQKVPFYEDN